MRYQTSQSVAGKQHGVITRTQLLELGYSMQTVKYHIRVKRLFPIHKGVYALGRPDLTEHGFWMAAVLSCGPRAILSHNSAGNLWKLTKAEPLKINISLPATDDRRRPELTIHRRGPAIFERTGQHRGIPVTTPAATLVDLATVLTVRQLEAAINEADKRELLNPAQLERELKRFAGYPGVRILRKVLEAGTTVLTDSELERRFIRLLKSQELVIPSTGVVVNGFKVDFLWPKLSLIVETDGWRYHRTPSQLGRDRTRDQVHTSRGFTTLRFTHWQVKNEPEHVSEILKATMARLGGGR